MMNIDIKKFIFLGLILVVASFLLKKHIRQKVDSPSFTQSLERYRVAILVPVVHPAMQDIRKGFIDTLSKAVSCVFDDYNANGNRTLLRSQAEAIVERKYDLIFTIATGPALVVKEVCDQRKSNVPVVAGSVDDPVGLRLIDSMQSSKNNIVAVTGEDFFEKQVELLKFLKPDFKKMLLVYNPGSGLDQKKDQVAKICKSKNIEFKAIEIFNINDLVQKVPAVITGCDVVFVLKDNLVVSGIESLVNLCNRTRTLLYASDLNSGEKGAALSYGVSEYEDGVEAAFKAIEILKEKKDPGTIPSSFSDRFNIRFNTATMKLQGLTIDPVLFSLIKSGEVI